MEWQLALAVILGSLLLLMATGMPVAFCFLVINVVGAFLLWGGGGGLLQLGHSIFGSVAQFTLLPVPLFILMGEIMFYSGLAPHMIDAIDKWMGRLPGRLGLVSVSAGTLFSVLTGASMASVAMLGSVLVPEMEKRGYKKAMSLGPILGSGGLAVMIPPSGLAVLLGAIAEISIGGVLIAIIIPGLLMAALYAAYIILRCWFQPSIAPPYDVAPIALSQKMMVSLRYIVPVGFIIFMVTGVIILGIATPTEAAAMGAFGSFILAAFYKRLNWEVVKKSVGGTIHTSAMLLMIIAGASAFSQILSYSGGGRGLVQFILSLPLSPLLVLIGMQIMLLFLGMFMSVVAIMMITIPLFMPVVYALGFDPIWFAVIFLLNMEMATTSPPFGLNLFVMKGSAPRDTTMGDIYRAALPFLGCDAIAMILIIAFPAIALWLPMAIR